VGEVALNTLKQRRVRFLKNKKRINTDRIINFPKRLITFAGRKVLYILNTM
jgi:hypothetical protein